nr:hypothetical protein [Tanacetum cinerariifolium]
FGILFKRTKSLSPYQSQLGNQQFEVGAELFRKVLQITPKVLNEEFVEPPPHNDLVFFFKQLGYTGSLELVSEMYIDQMYQPWRTFLSIINICLSRKSSSTQVPKKEQMTYSRFTKVIINHFVSKHNTIPKRHDSFVNIIKYDKVLGKFKFVNKREEYHKYGMSIPNSMMNDEIRNSAHYMTYLVLSTTKGSDNEKVEELSPDDERTETDGFEKAGNEKADEEIIDKEIVERDDERQNLMFLGVVIFEAIARLFYHHVVDKWYTLSKVFIDSGLGGGVGRADWIPSSLEIFFTLSYLFPRDVINSLTILFFFF